MPEPSHSYDVLILGAGAAGLMCAIEAAKRQRSVLVLDHANKPGKKILMSGGGRCNFTNRDVSAENYISGNPHFCKSALSKYTQWDFIQLVEQHNIPYHERLHGQLFCDNSAKDILNMLLDECHKQKVTIMLNTTVNTVANAIDGGFFVAVDNNSQQEQIYSQSLVIATGGLSIPKMCASPLGYRIATQFNITVSPTCAGLVPLTLQGKDKERYSKLSGIAVDAIVSFRQHQFRENILFTHRGLSGPAILQISSYWRPGEPVTIDMLPDVNLEEILETNRQLYPNKKLKTGLNEYLPKRLLSAFLPVQDLDKTLQVLSSQDIKRIRQTLCNWTVQPGGTEGYRTAEVTLGGIDCNELSSKTMEANSIKGLFFIGEVVDVTGWLGGYNFQWAWSSGWAAGQYV